MQASARIQCLPSSDPSSCPLQELTLECDILPSLLPTAEATQVTSFKAWPALRRLQLRCSGVITSQTVVHLSHPQLDSLSLHLAGASWPNRHSVAGDGLYVFNQPCRSGPVFTTVAAICTGSLAERLTDLTQKLPLCHERQPADTVAVMEDSLQKYPQLTALAWEGSSSEAVSNTWLPLQVGVGCSYASASVLRSLTLYHICSQDVDLTGLTQVETLALAEKGISKMKLSLPAQLRNLSLQDDLMDPSGTVLDYSNICWTGFHTLEALFIFHFGRREVSISPTILFKLASTSLRTLSLPVPSQPITKAHIAHLTNLERIWLPAGSPVASDPYLQALTTFDVPHSKLYSCLDCLRQRLFL